MSQEQLPFNPNVLVENREYLRKLARSLVFDEHRADDLVQQACLALLERPPKRPGSLRSWMARVVQNLAYSMLARESERSWREKLAAGPGEPEGTSQSEERMFDEQQLLLDAVRKLRQPYRSAIFLRYYRDLSPTQIAAEEQLSLATVKTRLRRGLELLRAELDSSHAGQRGHWCLALLPLAAPLGALHLAGATGIAAYLKGLILMKKPIVTIVSALALAGVASLTWVALDGDRDEVRGSSPGGAKQAPAAAGVAAAPEEDALPEVQPGQEAALVGRSEVPGAVPSTLRPSVADFHVTGRVVDEGGAPLVGADVRLYSSAGSLGLSFSAFGALSGVAPGRGGVSAKSDSEGRFRLPVEGRGSMNLAVGADHFAPFRREILVPENSSFDAGDLQLDPGALLSGRVVDSAGRGVGGATIESLGPRSGPQVVLFGDFGSSARVAVADAEGYFSIRRHAVGPWRLRANSDEHPSAERTGQTMRAGEVANNIRIALADGFEIRGSVVGLPDDVPEGLVVVANPAAGSGSDIVLVNGGLLGGHRAKLKEGGEFRLRGLQGDLDYRLELMLGDRIFGGKRRSEARMATPGESGVQLVYRTPAALLFQVVDAETGEPIENYDLSAGMFALRSGEESFGAPDLSRHHPEGRMRLEDFQSSGTLQAASGSVNIQSIGYEDYSLGRLELTMGQEVNLGQIRMIPVPVVRVTVRDRVSGDPVAGARVRMTPEQPEPEQLGGMRRMSVSMNVDTGPDGISISDDSADESVRGVTDENGVCVLTSMPGESVRIRVSNDDHAPYSTELIRLDGFDDVEREVRLEEGSTVQILVVDAEGTPQAGMAVKHRAPDEDQHMSPMEMFERHEGPRARTDSDGMLYFENLNAGTHRFALDEDPFAGGMMFSGMHIAGGRAPAPGPEWSELRVEPGAELTLTLQAAPRGSLSGVVREGGSTLAGARVKLLPADSGRSSPGFSMPGMGGSMGPSAVTDSKGRYELEAVPTDDYRIEVTHPNRQMPTLLDASLRAGRNELDVALSVSMIEGRITDPEGNPLAGLKVSVSEAQDEAAGGARAFRMVAVMVDESGSSMTISDGDESRPVSTDAEGYYQLRGVAFGKPLVVEASGAAYAAVKSETLELREGETLTDIDLQLRAAGEVKLVVEHSDGSQAGGFLVSAIYQGSAEPAPEPATGFIGPDGRGHLGGLLVGPWEVSLTPMGGPGGSSEVLPPLPQQVLIEAGVSEMLEFEVE